MFVYRRFLLKIITLGLCILYSNDAFSQADTSINSSEIIYKPRTTFQFQPLYIASWDFDHKSNSNTPSYLGGNVLINRARFRVDGKINGPNVTYKFQIGYSNQDMSSPGGLEFGFVPNLLYDASLDVRLIHNFHVQFGQAKLPGNREWNFSSLDLQFINRSLLTSAFNLDRDLGIQFANKNKIGNTMVLIEQLAISKGKGRNVIIGNQQGQEYTAHIEFLPFGEFRGNGDQVGPALVFEDIPKLNISLTYDYNSKAIRTDGNLGTFIKDSAGNYYGKPLHTFFVDGILKYKKISAMCEYAYRKTKNDSPNIYDNNGQLLAVYTTGNAFNIQMGYLFRKNWELAGRYTQTDLQSNVPSHNYSLDVNKYFYDNRLKIQSMFSYLRKITSNDDVLSMQIMMQVYF